MNISDLNKLAHSGIKLLLIGLLPFSTISNAEKIDNNETFINPNSDLYWNPFNDNNYNRNNDDLNPYYKSKKISKRIRGYAVTGHNDILGEPFYDWGPPFGSFGFFTVGIYNEFGPEPLSLSRNVSRSALVSTALDPNLLASTGVTPAEVDPAWINVPLRDVPIQYSFGKTKQFPGISSANSSEKAQSEPTNPITIAQWMKASGTAKIACTKSGSTIKLRMENLIPNRMYGVWATLGMSASGDPEVFPSIPIGGTPNLFITDEDGDAVFKRSMQFCPLAPDSTDRPLLVINVQYHSNHQNYGGINGPPLEKIEGGYWIGTVIHNHLQFPVNVTLLNNE